MSETKQYGSKHLAAIAAEQITTKFYAEREGLSAASLYYWRRRLKADAAPGKPATNRRTGRQLVPAQITEHGHPGQACRLALAPGVYLELGQLPDPQWLACLAAATAGPVR